MSGMLYLPFSLFVFLSLAFLSLLDISRILLLLLFLKCSLSIESREKDSQTDSPVADLRPPPHTHTKALKVTVASWSRCCGLHVFGSSLYYSLFTIQLCGEVRKKEKELVSL